MKDKSFKINIEEHFGLVHLCAQRFRGRGQEYDDIFQSGCIGLTKAAKKFDASRGVQFSTYAVPVILGEIKALFREGGALKVSRYTKELAFKLKAECEKFIRSYEREPSVSELADIMNVSQNQVITALDSIKAPISLDGFYGLDNENNECAQIPVPFDDEKISSRILVTEAMNAFKQRDKNLIYLRFFKGITQSETAKSLGMTQVQVSRREKMLLQTLRKKLA